MARRARANGWRERERERKREEARVPCLDPELQRVVFPLQLRVRGREVLDSFFVVAFRFGELGGLGLQVFDAGGEVVYDVGILVGACHVVDGSIDGKGWKGCCDGGERRDAAGRRNVKNN